MIRIQITEGVGYTAPDVDFIQVRDPRLNSRELANRVRELMNPGRPGILVNDRTDVALACGAAGVHLRDNSTSPQIVRRITPPGFIITVACHDAEAVYLAAENGADYAILAPIFAPLSKPLQGALLGIDALGKIARHSKIPVIALGGITVESAQQCVDAGAAGVAGITLFRSL